MTHWVHLVEDVQSLSGSGTNRRILLTGASGQVGYELRGLLAAFGDVVATTRAELDLADEHAIRRLMRDMRPVLVVNTAAYTAVDRAEQEPEAARLINAAAPRILAEEAARLSARFIHYSTDYVFDGRKTTPYRPDDEPNPISVYGMTKLEGERAITAVGGEHLIIRTGWIYAMRGRNFLLTILGRAASGRPLRVVSDQRGCPNWARLIAEGTVDIIRAARSEDDSHGAPFRGIYHLSCRGEATWYEFAEAILEHASLRTSTMLAPITSAEFAATAQRPAYSRLCCDTTREQFGVELCDWREGLRRAWAHRAIDAASPSRRTGNLQRQTRSAMSDP